MSVAAMEQAGSDMGYDGPASFITVDDSATAQALDYINSQNGPVRVAIVGSRGYGDLGGVQQFVYQLPDGTTIVSGGARGVDITAEQAANERGLNTDIYPADWNQYGRRAGYVRNVDIVNNSDVVVAFHDGSSAGTQSTIDIATGNGTPVFIIRWGFPGASPFGGN